METGSSLQPLNVLQCHTANAPCVQPASLSNLKSQIIIQMLWPRASQHVPLSAPIGAYPRLIQELNCPPMRSNWGQTGRQYSHLAPFGLPQDSFKNCTVLQPGPKGPNRQAVFLTQLLSGLPKSQNVFCLFSSNFQTKLQTTLP